jgi:hypothetical protein
MDPFKFGERNLAQGSPSARDCAVEGCVEGWLERHGGWGDVVTPVQGSAWSQAELMLAARMGVRRRSSCRE